MSSLSPSTSPVKTESTRGQDMYHIYSFLAFFGCLALIAVNWIYQCNKRRYSRRIPDAGVAHIADCDDNNNNNNNSTNVDIIYGCQPNDTSSSTTDQNNQGSGNNTSLDNIVKCEPILATSDISNRGDGGTFVTSSSSSRYTSYTVLSVVPVFPTVNMTEFQSSTHHLNP